MNIIINIDEDMFMDIREVDSDFARNMVRNYQATIADAIRNGTPIPDNATNGDIIKAMFPKANISICGHVVEVNEIDSIYVQEFHIIWWNAPYKEVENGIN